MHGGCGFLTFTDYQRTYTVLYATLQAAEARIHRACIFFSVVGTAKSVTPASIAGVVMIDCESS